MFTLQQINTADDGANGADATSSGGDGGNASSVSEAFDGDDNLGSLESGGLDLDPKVGGGGGGGALAGQPGAPGGDDITGETIDGVTIVTETWGAGDDGDDGGAGGNGAGASLTLSNDELGSSSAYYSGYFELTLNATGGGGTAGANGGGGGDAGYTSPPLVDPVAGNTYDVYDGSQGGAGADGGDGGSGGGADDYLTGLTAYATNEAILSLYSIGGGGAVGGYGGAGGGGESGGVGGDGGDGGNGGAATASLTGSTVVSQDSVFVTLSATGGQGDAGEPGGGGGEGDDQGDITDAASGVDGNGGDGGSADDLLDNDSFTAPALQIQTEVHGGAAGGANGDGGLGSAGSESIAIENSTFTATAGEFNQLALDISEQNGSGAYVAVDGDGASGANLVFSGNDFAGTGSSTLYLGVQGGGVVVDALDDRISVGGSSWNTMTGFSSFHLDNDDTILLAPGATAYVDDDLDTVVITAGHVGGTIVDAASGDFQLDFSGFTGLTLQQLQNDTTISNGNTVISLDGGTVTLDGYTGGLSTSNTQFAPCFLRGTRIRLERGEVAVEDLRLGDRVVTASGASRPIVWIGRRALDIARHPDPAAVRPVRVAADAFGEGRPCRDLWLSPGHCVALEGAQMPISALINGRSVMQIDRDRVEYWHVELDAHDILFSEGLASESYLDQGNRTGFDNGGAFIEAHPDFRPKHTTDTCLPFVQEGPVVSRAKALLLSRLFGQGHGIVREAAPRVVVDGRGVEPIRLSEMRLGFALPADGRDIALCSRTFVPAQTVAGNSDIRELGLSVARLQIDGDAIALDEDAPCASGWHRAEYDEGRFARRWTTGATPLPAGARFVIVDLAGFGCYWSEPEDEAVARRA